MTIRFESVVCSLYESFSLLWSGKETTTRFKKKLVYWYSDIQKTQGTELTDGLQSLNYDVFNQLR